MAFLSCEAPQRSFWRLIILLLCSVWAMPAVPMAQAQVVKIGALLPLSGPVARIGADQLRGMQLAFDAGRSRAASSGHSLELLIADDECKPDVAVRKVRQLTEQDRTSLLLGAPCTGASTAVAAYAQDQRVPFLTAGSPPSQPAQPGGRQRMVFQLGGSRETVARLAQELSSKTGLKVDGGSGCLWTYEPFVPDGSVASVCPSLGIERERWQALRQRYRQKFGSEPSAGAAVGFAAMEIVLEAMRGRVDRQGEIVTALTTQTFDTILGRVNVGEGSG